jgi:uncharacterized repeat protein (TIGR03803 family)
MDTRGSFRGYLRHFATAVFVMTLAVVVAAALPWGAAPPWQKGGSAGPGVAVPAGSGSGTLVWLRADGPPVELHAFSGADGSLPVGRPIAGADGALYGVTSAGGAGQQGVLYRLSVHGVFKILHAFTGAQDGGTPKVGLTLASDGTLYGVTSAGGAKGHGTLFRCTPEGQFETVCALSEDLGTDLASPLLLCPDSTIYGAARSGGTSGQGAVLRLGASGCLETLHTFWTDEGVLPLSGLVRDDSGRLYASASQGGRDGMGTLLAMDADGSNVTILKHFQGLSRSQPDVREGASPVTLYLGPRGELFGTTLRGGEADAGILYKSSVDGSDFEVLYTYTGSGDDPKYGMVFGEDGSVFIPGQTTAGLRLKKVYAPEGAKTYYVKALPAMNVGADGTTNMTTLEDRTVTANSTRQNLAMTNGCAPEGDERYRLSSCSVTTLTGQEYLRAYTAKYSAATTIGANATAYSDFYMRHTGTSVTAKATLYEYNDAAGIVGTAKGTASYSGNAGSTSRQAMNNVSFGNASFTVATENRLLVVYAFDMNACQPAYLWGQSSGCEPSGHQSFTVVESPCSPPSAPSAPTFTSVARTTLTVNWTAVSGATSYDVWRAGGGTCSGAAKINASPVAGTSYADSNLTCGSLYSYFIIARNSCGSSANGSCSSLTTAACPAPPLRVPHTVNPAIITTSNQGADGTLTWDATNCASTNYHLIYGKGENLPAWAIDGGVCSLGSAGSFVWSGLPDPASYTSRFLWWLVVGDDGEATEGSWGLTSAGDERGGTNASGQCGMTMKVTSGSCGIP